MNSICKVLLHPLCRWIKDGDTDVSVESMEGIPEGSLDFSFGFDDANYSDRTLLLQFQTCDDHTDDAISPSPAPQAKAIHINSLILAARSPFFHKLFSNGMRESEQKNVTLQISASEEASFTDLLKYVYSNNLPTSLEALLNLLVMADKFEVASCFRDCTRTLQDVPMTCELAFAYLDFPPTLLMSPTVEPLVDEAKKFLVANFKDLRKFKNELLLNLSLLGIQAVLSSDDLQVASEIEVYDTVLEWVRKHYPNLWKRREILKTHLLHLVRFPFMTVKELTEEVQTCSDIYPELASEIIIRALSFKAETPHQKRLLAAEECNVASRQFVERAYYTSRAIKIKAVELELPLEQCVVYLDFKRGVLKHIFPDDQICSDAFHLGPLQLTFIGKCSLEKPHTPYFWLALDVRGSSSCTLNYDIALRKTTNWEFQHWCKGKSASVEPGRITNLYRVPWSAFTGDGSTFFINDIFHMGRSSPSRNDQTDFI